jgi:hypothetical protein
MIPGVSLLNTPHGTNREVALKKMEEAGCSWCERSGCGLRVAEDAGQKRAVKEHSIRREKNITQQYMCQRTQLERLKPGSQPSLQGVVQEGSTDPRHWGRRHGRWHGEAG